MLRSTFVLMAAVVSGTAPAVAVAQTEPVRVVTTLSVYADLVRAIGGPEVEVHSIASPHDDAHFVRPKPSFALQLRRADAFVTTGLDLELWVPAVLDRAGNARVSDGGTGYITAYTGIELLDIPAAVDRSSGDVHLFGNPHLTTDPLRAVQVARNIAVGLKRVAPDRAEAFDRGLAAFEAETWERMFGAQLVLALGGETLDQLARGGGLMEFLEQNQFEGAPLADRLGGWLGRARPLRGARIICYHKNWAYLEDRFGVECADYVEARPGIAPTPRHVAELIDEMRDQGIRVLLAANYFDAGRVETIAERGGATPVIVPLYSDGTRGSEGYFALVDHWLDALLGAMRAQ